MPRIFRDPCLSCGHAERNDAPQNDACAFCGAPRVCPNVTDWPPFLKRWLRDRIMWSLLKPHGGDVDAAWKHLLAVSLRGAQIDVPTVGVTQIFFAASADDVYGIALRLAKEHETARDKKKGDAAAV